MQKVCGYEAAELVITNYKETPYFFVRRGTRKVMGTGFLPVPELDDIQDWLEFQIDRLSLRQKLDRNVTDEEDEEEITEEGQEVQKTGKGRGQEGVNPDEISPPASPPPAKTVKKGGSGRVSSGVIRIKWIPTQTNKQNHSKSWEK